jgi:membrane-anchored glycerophosphoryl diester phosphodiesterase (GDPDase)
MIVYKLQDQINPHYHHHLPSIEKNQKSKKNPYYKVSRDFFIIMSLFLFACWAFNNSEYNTHYKPR